MWFKPRTMFLPLCLRVTSYGHVAAAAAVLTGKDYQELRVKKRQRRQPGTIPNLPYLYWEKTGDPPAGPYAVRARVVPFGLCFYTALMMIGEILVFDSI